MLTLLKDLFRIGRDAGISAPNHSNGNRFAPYYVSSDDGSRVDIVKHARGAGLENLPESSATEPNDVEAAVQREHERRHRDLVERTRSELSSLTATFEQIEQRLPISRDLHVAVEQAKAGIEHDLAAEHAFVPLRQEQQRRRRNLRKFIRERQLNREAHYPASRVWHLGIVAVIVVVESLLNTAFLAGASSLGLVGGLFAAIGVSVINAVIGLLAGFFAFRWRNHHEARLRNVAGVGVGLYVVVVIAFNWVVARYRDAAGAGVGQVHLSELVHGSAGLSVNSAALLLLGILASLFAARKGFTTDDRVPDFGDHDREFRGADRALSEHTDALRRGALGRAEGVPRVCDGIIEQAAHDLEQLGQTVVCAERSLEAYEAERERIERWCHQYLRRYRSENEAVRTTPAPKYFSDYPSFESQLDAKPIASLKVRLGRAGARLDLLKEEAQRIALEQSGRVEAARDRVVAFLRDSLHRADAGRGDGSASDARAVDGPEGVPS